MESLNCPNCRAPLSDAIIGGKTECPYCSSIILIGTGCNEVKDINTGIIIGEAESPKGYVLSGYLDQNIQSSCYPLTTLICCENKRKHVKFFKESGKAFQQILKHLLLHHQEGQMESNYQIPMFTFKGVEEYLDMYAINYAQGKEIKYIKEMDLMPVNVIDSSIPVPIQVEMELQAARLSYGIENNYNRNLTRLYKIEDEYLLLSTTILGIKWYVNAPMMMGGFGDMTELSKKITNGIKSIFGSNNQQPNQEQTTEVVNNSLENIMKIPTVGKPVSFTNWWTPAIYGLQLKKLPDFEILKDFSLFCCTAKESNNILERRYQITNQMINNMYVSSQQEFARADQFSMNAQADIQRRQAQISQSIQQRNDIIMSVHENRMSAQDRMNKGYSEAIRGVDTYMGSNGLTEFKTGAKRVIEKNNDPKNKIEIGYLDTVPQGWTEIFKQ